MSEDVREQGREQRSESRERRRSFTAEPFENLDREARSEDAGSSGGSSAQDTALGAAKRAAGAAAVAAVAGGLAGAAKALLDRRRASAATDADDRGEASSPEAVSGDG